MLYSKAHFAVRHAASTDETRYNLNGVHFCADGSTEATDGHMLIRVQSKTPPAEDHPRGTEGEVVPFILPLEAANQVAKGIPKRSAYPVLAHAALDVPSTNENGAARFLILDTYGGNDSTIESKKIEGEYPTTDQVVNPTRDHPLSFRLNLTLVERLIKASKEFGGSGKGKDHSGKPLKGAVNHFATFYSSGNDSAVRIVIENPDVGELEALIMPVRI